MKKLKQYCIVLVLCLTVLSGCSLPGLGSNSSEQDIKITALATSESQIMSHMLRLLIEHDTNGEIKPTLINNLGSSTIQHNALVNGDANMSGARYNGTDLTGALNEDPIKDPKKLWKQLKMVSKNSTKPSLTLTVLLTHTHLWSLRKQQKNII